MARPSSGPISLYDVNIDLSYAGTAQISLNDVAVRALTGLGGSGQISMSDLYLSLVDATGGDYVYRSGNYRFHEFTNSGTFTLNSYVSDETIFIYLIGSGQFGYAGNAGGGFFGGAGGGGGSGGSANSTSYSCSTLGTGNLTVTLGVFDSTSVYKASVGTTSAASGNRSNGGSGATVNGNSVITQATAGGSGLYDGYENYGAGGGGGGVGEGQTHNLSGGASGGSVGGGDGGSGGADRNAGNAGSAASSFGSGGGGGGGGSFNTVEEEPFPGGDGGAPGSGRVFIFYRIHN